MKTFNLSLAFAFFIGNAFSAETNSTSPSPVFYQHIVRQDPNFSIHVVTIDLADPRVSTRVARGGPDPDGDGPWTTTLLPVREIANREGFDIAINGDFFTAEATKDIEGRNTGYIKGKFASPEGMAMTDGELWHHAEKSRPYLIITTNHTAQLSADNSVVAGAYEVIGGNPIILQGGKALEYKSNFATNRHPRTVIGLDHAGTKLTILVVDGRQPKLSIGMTLHELSEEMIRLGCESAINLDGGGSTTLVYREPVNHVIKVVNSPSDTKERSVADVLGITVHAEIPPTN